MAAASKGGTECPCCGQFVKLYRRRLNNALAHALILMVNRPKTSDPWFHVPTYLASQTATATIRGGDWAKLTYWDLIEPLAAERRDGSKRSGFYKVTDKGYQFARGRITVPKYAYVYNSTLYGFSDGDKYPMQTTTIREALGAKFNYAELMGTDSETLIEKLTRTLNERKGPQRAPKGGV